MRKEKQIEEMAKIIGIPCYKRIEAYGDGSIECPSPLPCNECTAELLYTAGYRKQDEVIKDFVKRFEKYIGNCTFTMGQTNDILYALKMATEETIGE
jgi:hypothetical protein